jgi:3-hydroxyisobutyrate dehydrogenase
MAGASDAALEKGKFLLQAMSDANKLYLVPGGIGAGSNMKMVHQVLAGIHILGASEAMGFAAQLGLDAVKTADAIKSSDSWTWMHENRLQRMLEEDWHPGASALTIILKDVVSFEFAAGSFRLVTNTRISGNYYYLRPPEPVPHTPLLHG